MTKQELGDLLPELEQRNIRVGVEAAHILVKLLQADDPSTVRFRVVRLTTVVALQQMLLIKLGLEPSAIPDLLASGDRITNQVMHQLIAQLPDGVSVAPPTTVSAGSLLLAGPVTEQLKATAKANGTTIPQEIAKAIERGAATASAPRQHGNLREALALLEERVPEVAAKVAPGLLQHHDNHPVCGRYDFIKLLVHSLITESLLQGVGATQDELDALRESCQRLADETEKRMGTPPKPAVPDHVH